MPYNQGNKKLKRIAYIKAFLNGIRKENTKVIVIDEAGFGTHPLRRYSYSKIG